MKGGCAKTTTAVNLAAALSKGDPEDGIKPQKVLLIDLDPQGNVATSFGIEKSLVKHTISNLLMDDDGEILRNIEQYLLTPELITESMQGKRRSATPNGKIPEDTFQVSNLWILPSDINLTGANIELSNKIGRETRLRDIINEVASEFDHIIIDTSPSVSLLTINALVAANFLLVPVQPEWYAIEGLGQMLETVNQLKRQLNPRIKLFGILETMRENTTLHEMVSDEIRRRFDHQVFEEPAVIFRRIAIAEAVNYGAPIVLLQDKGAPKKFGRGAKHYWSFFKQFNERMLRYREKKGYIEPNKMN